MPITINIYYTGRGGSAKRFAEEMEATKTAAAIRGEKGNLRYDYYVPLNDDKTVLLIDEWESQSALDIHHASPMMKKIAELREKYGLTMKVERYLPDNSAITENDRKYIV